MAIFFIFVFSCKTANKQKRNQLTKARGELIVKKANKKNENLHMWRKELKRLAKIK